MGISVSKGKGQMGEPNVVPFIDILLVLIIIFMVITPLTPQGLGAVVPQDADRSAKAATDPNPIVIQIACDVEFCSGTSIKINQRDVTWETLGPELSDILKERAERVAFIKASDDLDFAVVARAMDIAKAAGVEQIGLLGRSSTL